MTSVVLATDFRVSDFERWSVAMTHARSDLASLGVRRYVAYRAIDAPNRVFLTLGLTRRDGFERALADPELLGWYDAAGIEEIPPVFVGTTVHKLVFDDSVDDFAGSSWPSGSVIVASIVSVRDFTAYRDHVYATRSRMVRAGIRQFWIYRAVDDADEVMALQEIDTLEHASAWLEFPDARAEFYRSAGVGVYPPVFVGEIAFGRGVDD